MHEQPPEPIRGVGRPQSAIGRRVREIISTFEPGDLVDSRTITNIGFSELEAERGKWIVNYVAGILSYMMRVEQRLDPCGTYHPGDRRGRAVRLYKVKQS